jgi:hypothetical protein
MVHVLNSKLFATFVRRDFVGNCDHAKKPSAAKSLFGMKSSVN